MAINYKDLNPTEASFRMNKREYFLRPFDLAARVWADDEFATEDSPSGLVNLSRKIDDFTNFSPLLKCAWYLLRNKKDFGFYDQFIIDIENSEEGSTAVIGDIYRAFVKTLGVSDPMIEEIKEELELKKF